MAGAGATIRVQLPDTRLSSSEYRPVWSPAPAGRTVAESLDDSACDEPRCPLCNESAYQICEHVLATSVYGDSCGDIAGWWAGDYERLKLLAALVNQLINLVSNGFSESQINALCCLVRIAGGGLSEPLAESIHGDSFATPEWNEYLDDLIRRSPGYVGEVECHKGSCPAEDWLTFFGADKKKAGRWLDRQIGRDITLVRRAVWAAKKVRPAAS
jgi:hypothetical protein